MNHHPEFKNSYNILSFSFCTHDAGMKITDLDIETATEDQRARQALSGDALMRAEAQSHAPRRLSQRAGKGWGEGP